MAEPAPRKFAAISDIHGNSDALLAVLDDIDRLGITEIVNLGDHLSGPLAAAKTANILMNREMVCIRGNHDRWLVEKDPGQMGASDKVAYDQLNSVHLDWLRSLPATGVHAGDVFLCHGTPDSDTTYWMEQVNADATVHVKPIDDIEAAATGVDFPIILCGHTHLPRAVRLRDGRLLVNPGSVGCPGYDDDKPVYHVMQTGTPDACYAILDKRDGAWNVTFRFVPYDSRAMVAAAEGEGRSEWASALATGWVR